MVVKTVHEPVKIYFDIVTVVGGAHPSGESPPPPSSPPPAVPSSRAPDTPVVKAVQVDIRLTSG